MTQVFRADGTVVPVTRVEAGPCVVTQVRTADHDGVEAIEVGYGTRRPWRVKKPQQGHLQGLTMSRWLRSIRLHGEHGLKRGDVFTVKIFVPGEKVQVTGTGKGKGFQGVVKRHHFHGSPASHGHKDQLRMPGSIGAGGVQRTFKNLRMAGHMGDERVTIKNLEVMGVDEAKQELLLKGAVPGARGALLIISTPDGKIEIEAPSQLNGRPDETGSRTETSLAAETSMATQATVVAPEKTTSA